MSIGRSQPDRQLTRRDDIGFMPDERGAEYRWPIGS